MRTYVNRRSFLAGVVSSAAFAFGSAPIGAVGETPRPRLGSGHGPTSSSHPFVFSAAPDIQRFLDCSSASAASAKRLAEARCRSALAKMTDHASPFSGCTLNRYLSDLTDEHRGAAQAASSLALYACLHQLSGSAYGDRELAERAGSAAKLILMNWAREGMREYGVFRAALKQYCDEKGDVTLDTEFAIGLQLGRGVPYLIHATDLMLGAGRLHDGERAELDDFFRELFALILLSANFRARRSNLDCNRYSNHVSVQLAALIAIARFRRDRDGLADAAFGTGGQLAIPWVSQVSRAIYGPRQAALNCYRAGASQDFVQNQTPVAGEIVDRFRARAEQTFGYPMLSLTHLLLGAKVLAASEFPTTASLVDARSRLLAALTYYGEYFSRLLSPDEVRVPPGFRYPGSDQYTGKVVSRGGGATIEGRDGLLLPFLLGHALFPGSPGVEAVIRRAGQFAPDHQPFSAVSSLYVPDICS